jgi:hypothetical protein
MTKTPEQLFADELIEQVRRTRPDEIAKEICSVQPLSDDVLRYLTSEASTDADLIEHGFRPVSSLGLVWIR